MEEPRREDNDEIDYILSSVRENYTAIRKLTSYMNYLGLDPIILVCILNV